MKRKILIFSLLIGVGILFGKNVFCLVKRLDCKTKEVVDSPCPTTAVINTPLPCQTFLPGENVTFSGSFQVPGCGNYLSFNKVTFYLTEDKDMPITTANGCSDCLGAISYSYDPSKCNTQYCDQIKVIDEEKAKRLGYKIHKLGSIYASDQFYRGASYKVFYQQTFQIPLHICERLGFSPGKNKIRFYIQFSGIHGNLNRWSGHWHWSIIYQPGYLVCPPISPQANQPPIADAGEDQAVKEGSWITLDGSGSYDPDGDPLTYQWSASDGKIISPTSKITPFQVPFLKKDEKTRYIYVTLKVTDSKGASDSDTIIISVKKVKYFDLTLTSDLTGDWIWQTKPLTLTWDSENASQCRRWIEIWNPFENVKLKDTSLGDKIPHDNWTSDWNDETSGTITTYPGSGPPDPQTGSQPRNWIGKLWIYKIECKDSSGQNIKKAEVQVNVKPRPIWQELFPF